MKSFNVTGPVRNKFLSALFVLFIAFLSLDVAAQNCATTQPNPSVCSATVAETFTNSTGSFTGTGLVYNGTSAWTKTESGNGGTFTYTMTSPSYYKTKDNPNNVRAGFKLTTGDKITANQVKLEIIRRDDLAVLGTCTQTVSINNSSATVCIGVFSTLITEETMFMYKFTISANTGNGSGNRTITFDDFSYGGDSNAPLPVDFGDFSSARLNSKDVLLKWTTYSEANNTGFEVQRKLKENNDFTTVGFVHSKSEQGNSNSKLEYEFTDNNTYSVNSYYRIRQVDFDGKSKYSEVRLVNGVKSKTKSIIFPNPASGSTASILFSSNVSKNITITDLAGRQVKMWKAYSDQSLKIGNLIPGMYLISIQEIKTGEKELQRLIISQ